MKNLILSAAIIALAGMSTVKADTVKAGQAIVIGQDSTAKVPVALDALPEAVKTTLKADAYKEWTPTTAYLVTNADKTSFYQIDVKNQDKLAFIKISKEGTVIQ